MIQEANTSQFKWNVNATDYAYLQNEEHLKYVAPPSRDYYEQAIWSYIIQIGSIDDYIWRHRGVFLISQITTNNHESVG